MASGRPDWAIVYFGQLFIKVQKQPTFWGKSNTLILTKNVLVYILGDFFTNWSGHTGRDAL
jgi:hypothetical protein